MKVKSNELFKFKNLNDEKIERCILVAIKNKREGNFKDFNFIEEKYFIKYLNALINKGLIIRNKLTIHKNEINIEDFSYIENSELNLRNYYKTIKYLREHVIELIGLGIAIASIFVKN